MLSDRRITRFCGLTKAGRPADGFLTCPVDGEPDARAPLLIDVRRNDGSIPPAFRVERSSTGDAVMVSSKLDVDEHERVGGATLPNRKGGNCVSGLVDRLGVGM